jgi:hypothetical protein
MGVELLSFELENVTVLSILSHLSALSHFQILSVQLVQLFRDRGRFLLHFHAQFFEIVQRRTHSICIYVGARRTL